MSTGDILGKEDLNNLLGKFPEVERHHFKLWLTSQTVMERVLHSKIFNQSEFDIDSIRQRLKYYVQNKSFFEAGGILEEEHYCVIAGMPGIGKTTLAEVIVVDHIGRGYEAFSVTSDISEAYEVYNKSEKQIFYYDDFLGQTSFEEKLGKNEDRSLLRFIETVRRSPNTKLILTTREYVLNQAKAHYEKLAGSDFDRRRCVIDLSSYTQFDRARILFNHVYFSELPEDYVTALLAERSYRKIIDHPNFNPRIVEWMTQRARTLGVTSDTFVGQFLSNLDNPAQLWRHAFENQISIPARHLLIALASLPQEVFLEDIEEAFTSLYEHGAKRYGFVRTPRDFVRALKEAEGNFIDIVRKDSHTMVRFHNPSVRDFMNSYLATHPDEVIDILDSAVYFQQCVVLWTSGRREGSAPTSRDVLLSMPDALMGAMTRTFESGDCGFTPTRYVRSDGALFKKRMFPLEGRLLSVLATAQSVESAATAPTLARMLGYMFRRVLEHLKSNEGNKELLIKLLTFLKDSGLGLGEMQIEFLEASKQFLMHDLQELEDFIHFAEFRRLYRDSVTQDDDDIMAERFRDFYPQDIKSYLEGDSSITSDVLFGYADLLSDAASSFGIRVDDEVEEIKGYAEQLEQESREENEGPEQDYEYPSTSREPSGGSIDSMFDALLDSPHPNA
jgi:hypothetical protein